jgi:hypothetical protein
MPPRILLVASRRAASSTIQASGPRTTPRTHPAACRWQPGIPLSPDYDVSAAAPGTTGAVGKTAQSAVRAGGDFRQDPGFKRSRLFRA